MLFRETPDYLVRKQKLEELRSYGIEPYPHHFAPSHSLKEVVESYGQKELPHFEEAEKGESPFVKVAGRMVLFRAMGKNAFAHIQEGEERLQLLFNRDLTQVVGLKEGEITPIKVIEKLFDLGDLLGVEGHLFRTQKGELTLFVKKVELLSKALLPLPEKHSGLVDKEIRYRKRWLDLISHKEVFTLFQKRSELLSHLRDFMKSYQFIEVETPILQNLYGGAEARPFMTHLNALDEKMYLRISLEISLKKLIIGGYARIFEIGKIFRNEGIDKTHNPEFTMMEAYATYWDYNEVMSFTEKLVEYLAIRLHGTTLLQIDEEKIDFKAPWKRMTMKESLKEIAGLDVDGMKEEEMRALLTVDPKVLSTYNRGLLIAALFDEKVSSKLIQPTHITDHPIETTPLCKPHRSPKEKREGLVERFESFVYGKELCNAYSELNDPELQRELLEEQAKKRAQGNEEAHPLDEEFVEALAQGMPPAGGVGIGIDRLAMFLLNAHSIRDVLFFPIMKIS